MNTTSQTVLEFGIESTLQTLNEGFSDYIIPLQLDLRRFHHMLQVDGIDVSLSQVVFLDESPAGVALIARRGWTSRLAGMAIIPEARSKGVGHGFMRNLIEAAKSRDDRWFGLEVIEQNLPAAALYKKCGFEIIRRLVGYRVENPEGQPAKLKKVDIREVSNRINLFGAPQMPWQLSGESLAHSGPPSCAFQLESAWTIISNPNADQIYISALIVKPGGNELDQAVQLLTALFDRYPHKTWNIPAIFPEEMGDIFEQAGFIRQKLSQFQMELALKDD